MDVMEGRKKGQGKNGMEMEVKEGERKERGRIVSKEWEEREENRKILYMLWR